MLRRALGPSPYPFLLSPLSPDADALLNSLRLLSIPLSLLFRLFNADPALLYTDIGADISGTVVAIHLLDRTIVDCPARRRVMS